MRPEVPDEVLNRVRRAYNFGPLVYAVSVGLALWNAVIGLVVCASLWVLWSRLCYRPLREPEPSATQIGA